MCSTILLRLNRGYQNVTNVFPLSSRSLLLYVITPQLELVIKSSFGDFNATKRLARAAAAMDKYFLAYTPYHTCSPTLSLKLIRGSEATGNTPDGKDTRVWRTNAIPISQSALLQDLFIFIVGGEQIR